MDALIQDVTEFGQEGERDVSDLLSKLKDPVSLPIDAATKHEIEKGHGAGSISIKRYKVWNGTRFNSFSGLKSDFSLLV